MFNTQLFKPSLDFLIVVQQGGTPSDSQWQERLSASRAHVTELKLKGFTACRRLIIAVDGTSLSMAQAREVDHLFHNAGIACSTALMTRSSAVRALFLVTRWVRDNSVRVFSPEDIAGAGAFLTLNASEAFAVRQELGKAGYSRKSA